MRVAAAIALSDETRLRLEKLARGRSTPVRIMQRSRIVLLAGDGLQNKEIAERMEVAPRMVALWRNRFLTLGVDGLLRDASRPGRTPSISTQTVAQIIEKTTQSKPANATHWSRSTMAQESGISESSVGRIWRSHGLKPHRVTSFKVSNDPLFADKLEAIVGLYLDPPEHALVLSVDEKSQIQALDRTQPGLPMKKGRGATMTHDYKRNGTTTLFAALNVASGEIYGLCQQRHRHQEWLKFLRMIDQTVPAGKEIYLICDNYSTTGTINPGVMWVGGYFQVGLEAVIPINRESGSGVGALGQLHLYLDDMFPTTVGQPLLGGTSAAPRKMTF